MALQNANYGSLAQNKVGNLWNNQYAAADEGNYFAVTNPTPGTVIATTTSVVDDAATASATHAQNVPVMHYKNNNSTTNQASASSYPQFITMMLSQVPSSATTWRFAVRIGTAARYTSGGSLLVPQNVNGNSAAGSTSICYFGAVVTALDPANRLIANGTVGSVIPVTLDCWTFTFGDTVLPSNFLNGSASAKNVTIGLPPVIIPPGGYMQLEMWGASNAAAPSWEFTMGVIERPAGQ